MLLLNDLTRRQCGVIFKLGGNGWSFFSNATSSVRPGNDSGGAFARADVRHSMSSYVLPSTSIRSALAEPRGGWLC